MTTTTRVTCPACQHEFGINGGLNIEYVKKGLKEAKVLEPGDHTVCTRCYSPLRLHPEAGWREILELEWLDLDLDTRTLLKNAQKMLRNRKEPAGRRKYSAAITEQVLGGDNPPDQKQQKAALLNVGLNITLGVLNKMDDEEDLQAAGLKAIMEIVDMARIHEEDFGDKVRILVASSLALVALSHPGDLEKAKAEIAKGLKEAEEDAERAGVKVVNMSEQMPSEEEKSN